MNRTLWVLQLILGVYFLIAGVNHFIVPEGLPETMDGGNGARVTRTP